MMNTIHEHEEIEYEERSHRKDICERICWNLAFITAYHHRDVQIYRKWRAIVYICDPELSHMGESGDAASFARAMWEKWCVDDENPAVDHSRDLRFAYQGLYHAFNLMRTHMEKGRGMFPKGMWFGAVQERNQLAGDISCIERRLTELNRALGKKRTRLFLQQQHPLMQMHFQHCMMMAGQQRGGCWYPPPSQSHAV